MFIQMIQWLVLSRVVLRNIEMYVFSTEQKQSKQNPSSTGKVHSCPLIVVSPLLLSVFFFFFFLSLCPVRLFLLNQDALRRVEAMI